MLNIPKRRFTLRERSQSLPQTCQPSVQLLNRPAANVEQTKGITCSNSDLRSILSSSTSSFESNESEQKVVGRRRTLALLQRGSEVCGFLDPSNVASSMKQKREKQQRRTLSLVTWDSEAELAIDPTIIGSSIEAYLSNKLDKLEEESDAGAEEVASPQKPMAIKITRRSLKAQIEASHV